MSYRAWRGPSGSLVGLEGYRGGVTRVTVSHEAAAEVDYPVIEATAYSSENAYAQMHDVTLPAGIAADDLLLVFFTISSEQDGSVLTPSGWTQLYAVTIGTKGHERCFYRVATGSEGATLTVDSSPGGGVSASTAYRITNYDGVPSCGTAATGTSASPNPPSLSPSGGSGRFLWIAAAHTSASVSGTAPSGYSNLLNANTGVGNAWHAQTLTAEREYEGATEDPGVFTITSALWAANTVAVRGAASLNPVVLASAGSIATTGLTPVIEAGGSQTVAATAGTIATTGKTPVVNASSYPTVEATNTSTESSYAQTHDVSLPTGIESGDLLLLFFAIQAQSDGAVLTPSGWTQLYGADVGTNGEMRCWYRTANGAEGATVTVDSSPGGGVSAHVTYRISGWDASEVPEAATPATGTSTSPDSASLTPSWGSAKALWLTAAHASASTSATQPTNYGDLKHANTGGTNAWHAQMAVASRENEASSENPGAWTIGTSVVWVAGTVGVKGA